MRLKPGKGGAFTEILKKAGSGEVLPVYLFLGPTPLTRPLVQDLLNVLLPEDAQELNLEVISAESYSDEALAEALTTIPFLSNRKVVLVHDPSFLQGSKARDQGKPEGKATGANFITRLLKVLDNKRFVLIIQAETADRRTSSFKQLLQKGALIDLEVKTSDKRGAQDAARDFARKWVAKAGKYISPQALDLLLSKVGTGILSLQTEIDKLIICLGDRGTIEPADVENLVARHRDHELYELTEAMGAKDSRSCVSGLSYLLNQGVHPLAILQVLSLYLQRLLLILDALSCMPETGPASYNSFQKTLLPALKRHWGEPLPSVVKGVHPYQVYKMVQVARTFKRSFLIRLLSDLVHVDLDLKGGSRAPEVVLETLVLKIASRK